MFWCSRAFTRRTTGGKPQRFCSSRCRRALDAAGRRYILDALSAGSLTVADLCSSASATRALISERLLGELVTGLPVTAFRALPDKLQSAVFEHYGAARAP